MIMTSLCVSGIVTGSAFVVCNAAGINIDFDKYIVQFIVITVVGILINLVVSYVKNKINYLDCKVSEHHDAITDLEQYKRSDKEIADKIVEQVTTKMNNGLGEVFDKKIEMFCIRHSLLKPEDIKQ